MPKNDRVKIVTDGDVVRIVPAEHEGAFDEQIDDDLKDLGSEEESDADSLGAEFSDPEFDAPDPENKLYGLVGKVQHNRSGRWACEFQYGLLQIDDYEVYFKNMAGNFDFEEVVYPWNNGYRPTRTLRPAHGKLGDNLSKQ